MGIFDVLPRWPRVRNRENASVDADASSPAHHQESIEAPQDQAGWYDRVPSNAVAQALADHQEVPPEEVQPLYSSVDTDGLNDVLRSAPDATVTFTHCGYDVAVTGRGEIEVSGNEDE